jgi:hypothetical protein|tara:strand:+ start:1706 stop:1903 length:198 start_codon:yes stop_codon:yes gene_type:complete
MQAKNNILQNNKGDSIAFQVLRSSNVANVDFYKSDKLEQKFENISLEHANKLWYTAIKTGYEVAF